MSDTPNTATPNTDDKPKPAQRTRKPVSLSSVTQTITNKRGGKQDSTKMGKQLRTYVRGHRADLDKAFKWPSPHEKNAPYRPMPAKCAQHLIAHFTRGR